MGESSAGRSCPLVVSPQKAKLKADRTGVVVGGSGGWDFQGQRMGTLAQLLMEIRR
jgi:hypothetical protein